VKEESDAGTKIYGEKKILGKWYEKHSEVENGGTIIIKEIEPNKKYRFGIEIEKSFLAIRNKRFIKNILNNLRETFNEKKI
jgi:hypothetical protein